MKRTRRGETPLPLWLTHPKTPQPQRGALPPSNPLSEESPTMPQSLANVLIHVVFSTKNRSPLIQPDIEDELFAYLATACRSLG